MRTQCAHVTIGAMHRRERTGLAAPTRKQSQPAVSSRRVPTPAETVLDLQRHAGNHAVARVVAEPAPRARSSVVQRHERLSYPTVPRGEEDPRVRINVMIREFNASLRGPYDPIDKGLLHEIATATQLYREGKITHGKEISRRLTKTEAEARDQQGRPVHKGNDQSIMAVPGGGNDPQQGPRTGHGLRARRCNDDR